VVRHHVATATSAVLITTLVAPTTAAAHGPCDCLVPMLGKPGERVRIARTPAYRVIFNPRPRAYGSAMRQAGYQSAYQPRAPSATVVSRRRTSPARDLVFRVPDVQPGVYLVLIFDGSELGQHTTWAYYHVLGPARRPARLRSVGTMPRSRVAPASPQTDALVLAVAIVAGVTVVWRRRRT
jgi:hypothetical protein